MAKSDPEGAVRLYMMYLVDPNSLRDEAAIAKAEAAVEKAKDPIERLKAMAARDRAQSVDGEHYRQDFIANAKAWAAAEDIPVKVFLDAGVPAADLAEAGLAPQPASRRRAASSNGGGRGRAPRLSLDEVTAALPAGEFKLTDLAEAIGREVGTTRNYLNKLIEQGAVGVVGDDPNHDGRGKAAKVYVRA